MSPGQVFELKFCMLHLCVVVVKGDIVYSTSPCFRYAVGATRGKHASAAEEQSNKSENFNASYLESQLPCTIQQGTSRSSALSVHSAYCTY
jgi:hypothetical protein